MKRTICLMLAAVALSAATGCSTHDENAAQAQLRYEAARSKIYFQLAKDAYDAGKLDQCKVQLGKIMSSEKPFLPAYLLAAKVAMREDRYSQAHDYLVLALQASPDSAEAWSALAVLKEHNGDLDKALDAMTRAVALDPNDPEYMICLAEMQVRDGDIDRAVATLSGVEERFTTHVALQTALADLHAMQGNDEAAAKCLRRVVRVDPANIDAMERLGLSLAHAGRADQAAPILQRVVDKGEGSRVAATATLADCYLELGRHKQAEKQYAQLCHLQPANPDWRIGLAEVYAMQSRDLIALEHLETVLAKHPERADARALAGYLYYAMGDLVIAAEHLRVAIDQTDQPELVAVMLVKTLEGLGEHEQAAEVWAEFGGRVEVALSRGVPEPVATASRESFKLSGQAPTGSLKQ